MPASKQFYTVKPEERLAQPSFIHSWKLVLSQPLCPALPYVVLEKGGDTAKGVGGFWC